MSDPGFDKLVADAQKILGKGAKIPVKRTAAVSKALDAYSKENKEFHTAKEALEKKLLSLQNSCSVMKNSLRQLDDEVSNSDYELDTKNADNKKKIKQVQDTFSKWFSNKVVQWDDEVKALDELDKHMMNIMKYKGIDK